MAHRYLFADEAGCFTFKRKKGASAYFYLCTIELKDCSFSAPLLDIKRRLVAAGDSPRRALHATEDSQSIRDEVFNILAAHQFHIDITILEKSKAQPHTRIDEPTFYRYAWWYHFKHIGPNVCRRGEKTLITAAALGHKKTRAAFKEVVNNVAQSIARRDTWEVSWTPPTTGEFRGGYRREGYGVWVRR